MFGAYTFALEWAIIHLFLFGAYYKLSQDNHSHHLSWLILDGFMEEQMLTCYKTYWDHLFNFFTLQVKRDNSQGTCLGSQSLC